MFSTFDEFKQFCEKTAKFLHTIVECKLYNDFNFGVGAFMTDKFGGTYVNLKYDLVNHTVIDNFNVLKEPFTNFIDLTNYIDTKRKEMENYRNLEYISEEINSQY